MDYKIIPLKGFDKIKFGMTGKEVKALLGEPDEIEEDQNYGDTPDEKTTVYYYDMVGVSFSFDKEENYRLTEMSFESDEFVLENNIRTGMKKAAALAAAEKALGEYYQEDLSNELEDNENLESYSFDDANVSLWFEDNILSTIQIGPEWIDDDTIKWPK